MKEQNLQTYNNDEVVQWYLKINYLVPIEEKVFEKYKEILAKGKLLDIGVGGGRTTNYLIKTCTDYTGIDYSDKFIQTLKVKFKNTKLLCLDARDLKIFKTDEFDFINFSFNGIDYVGENDRKTILCEINRVLKPGGVFFFSTHNKNHPNFNCAPWLEKDLSLQIQIKTFLKLIPHLFKHLNQKNKQVFKDNYAIINDSAHNYSLMTFYTTPQYLKNQLQDSGFENIQLMQKSGIEADEKKLDEWIFVVCTKVTS